MMELVASVAASMEFRNRYDIGLYNEGGDSDVILRMVRMERRMPGRKTGWGLGEKPSHDGDIDSVEEGAGVFSLPSGHDLALA